MARYLPVLGFVLVVAALLFATAPDRSAQYAAFKGLMRIWRGKLLAVRARRMPWVRMLWYLPLLYLLAYIAVYQRLQDAVAAELLQHGIAQVAVGSLIIPHSAFFRRAYSADAGFSKSKKRARAEIAVRGSWWSGFEIGIDETGLAQINKLTGKKFVFSYLTDVKILRPAIHRHMELLLRSGQIDKYEIETFDNRGPYLLVALGADNRAKDAAGVAAELAAGLHTKLTKIEQLKVNQVVVKVVQHGAYLRDNSISIIARGAAGNY